MSRCFNANSASFMAYCCDLSIVPKGIFAPFFWRNDVINFKFHIAEQKGDEFEWIADSVAYTYDEAIRLAKYYIQHLGAADLPKKSKNKHLAI